MATSLYYNPFVPAFSNTGTAIAKAKLWFYYSGTNTLAPIYADADKLVPILNPVQANLAGKYVDVYLDSSITYKVKQTTASGSMIGDEVDPYYPGSAVHVPGGSSEAIGLFTDIGSQSIPIGIDVVRTTGYSTAGVGAGTYISDATANAGLAAAHPRFCKMDGGGRYWRLTGIEISFEQGGASATAGFDNRAIIQGCINYAKAVSIRKIQPEQDWKTYELWAPTLSMSNTDVPFDVTGPTNFLTISADLTLWGRNAYFACKAYNGGSLQTVTQAITGNAAWRGHGISIIGGTVSSSSFGIKGVSLFNFTLDGGSDRAVTGSYAGDIALSDYASNKGLRFQDTGIEKLYCEGVTIKRFRGEIWYLAQLSNVTEVTLVNCNGYSSNQSALNPSSGNLTVIGGNYGDAPISIESLGGIGQRFIGTRFYNSYQAAFSGAAGYTPPTGTMYHYSVPMNAGNEAVLPYIDFEHVIFDSCGAVSAGNYLRGTIKSIDTYFTLSYSRLTNKMVDLDISAVVHKLSLTSLVFLQGPPTLTTAISGSYPTTYCQPIEDIKIVLDVTRTANAISNGFTINTMVGYDGYIKQENCHVIVNGNPDALDAANNAKIGKIADVIGTVKSLPKVFSNSSFGVQGFTSWSAANKALSPTGPVVMLACSGAAGTYDITFTNPMDTANGYNYAHGQDLLVVYTGFTTAGTVFRFPASGGNWTLPRDIKLRAREDWIRFKFSKFSGKFHYVSHSCGSEIYDSLQVAGTGSIGYATGAGGTITQATSKATGVTLNKSAGAITMNNASLAASTAVSFTLTNSQIAADDTVVASIKSGATAGAYVVTVDAVGAGTCQISLRNLTAGALSEAVVINYVVVKGATA